MTDQKGSSTQTPAVASTDDAAATSVSPKTTKSTSSRSTTKKTTAKSTASKSGRSAKTGDQAASGTDTAASATTAPATKKNTTKTTAAKNKKTVADTSTGAGQDQPGAPADTAKASAVKKTGSKTATTKKTAAPKPAAKGKAAQTSNKDTAAKAPANTRADSELVQETKADLPTQPTAQTEKEPAKSTGTAAKKSTGKAKAPAKTAAKSASKTAQKTANTATAETPAEAGTADAKSTMAPKNQPKAKPATTVTASDTQSSTQKEISTPQNTVKSSEVPAIAEQPIATPVAHAPALELESPTDNAKGPVQQQEAPADTPESRKEPGKEQGDRGQKSTRQRGRSQKKSAAAPADNDAVATDASATAAQGAASLEAAATPAETASGAALEEKTAAPGQEQRSGDRKRRGSRRGKGKRQDAQAQQAASETDPSHWSEEMSDNFFAPDDEFFAAAIEESVEIEPKQQNGKNSKQEKKEQPAKATRKKMFVSVVPEEQIEVVLTEEGLVQEYYVDMLHQAKTKGNIYKGVIHNIDPNLQAAFVNYGAAKNGFLQIDEIHPEYYATPHESSKGRKYPPIQKVLKAGQEVLVQVVKEPAGTKGAFLTTYLSLPGRFLVLTPGREQIGVSRKVDNETERTRLRDMLGELEPGPGLGVIVRTVSMGASLENLQSDLAFLQRTWNEVRTKGTTLEAPSLVYQEYDLTTRAVRDYLTDEVLEIWVDDPDVSKSVTELANNLFPRKKNLVKLHKESTTLFERFNLQKQLSEIHSREVSLPSGGRLVIDPTEALTAIDINSGRSSGKSNFEDMAYRTNMDAAKMIPLQLRLRDIGGQIVVDFIEMRDRNHWRDVEKAVRAGMKCDRARYDVGKISSFGMLEIVRQRLGSSAISVSTEPCPHCKGTGVRRNMEWQSQQALRDIARQMRACQNQENKTLIYEADPVLALHLLNSKRQRLMEMEQSFGVQLEIQMKHAAIE